MALAAQESGMDPSVKNGNGIVQFNDNLRPTSAERYGVLAKKRGVLYDLEDATIHLVKYYMKIEKLLKNPAYKTTIPIKELALTAYNRGITNVIDMLENGHDPRTYGLSSKHLGYADKILSLSKEKYFKKLLDAIK